MTLSFRIAAFIDKWKFKGYVDPSLRDSVSWRYIDDAIRFIKDNKPKDEVWLIEVEGLR